MKCVRHDTVMKKDLKTGLSMCLRCDDIDNILERLEELNIRENYTIKDIESYLKGEDQAEIGKVLFVEDSNE